MILELHKSIIYERITQERKVNILLNTKSGDDKNSFKLHEVANQTTKMKN